MSNKSYINLHGTYDEYIETTDRFEQSLFKDVYCSLYNVLSSILMRNDHKRGDIITVLGERGSGKTSLLLSFVDSLMSVKKCREFMETIDKEAGVQVYNNVHFSVMENLDASMMDSSEDIFDILLSRMLKRIDKCLDEEAVKGRKDSRVQYDILQDFDDIYKIHQQIKRQKNMGSEKEILDGYSSLSALRNFQDSLELNHKFEKLVKNYLNIMFDNYTKWEEPKNYLIVPIDDLDMNSENGFESLEQIYRYIAVKNVIVIVTVKYSQIMQMAEKNGYKLYSESKIELNDSKIKYIRDYAKEYLAKLLPIQNRVYMPDMVVHQREIRGKWYTKEKVDENLISEKSIRESVLFKIRDKTGMCFHMCGETMHILEAESLRELRGYYGYLDSQLKEIYNKDKLGEHSDYDILLDNIEQFACDFLNRIVNKRLGIIHKERLLFLCELDYMNMGNYLIGNMVRKTRVLHYFKSSYGELLLYLYQSSRNNQEEKQFVNAVLVFYTYISQQESVKMLKENRNRNKEVINEIFFNSWAGSWSNYLLPKITDKKNEDEEKGSSDEMNEEGETDYQKGRRAWKEKYWEPGVENLWGCIEGIDLAEARPSIEWEAEKIVSAIEWIKYNKEKVKALEWMFIFFEEFYSGENKEDIILKAEQKESGKIEWSIGNEQADFNALAFIKHSYNYEEYFDKLHTAIANALMTLVENEESQLKIRQKLREGSDLYEAYKNWEKEWGKAVVPFQYTDIYYHMLSYLRNQNQNRGTVEMDYVFDILCNLLERIKAFLGKEDEAYTYTVKRGEQEEKRKQTDFSEKFKSCPIVEMFLTDKKPDDAVIKAFGKMVNRCAMHGTSSRRYRIEGVDLNTSDDADFSTYDW